MTVSLTNRLTLFSLVALGVVLAAFSGAMYALARTHLMRQLNDRATATLDTLVAAAEVEGDGLEWEPKERRILLRGDGAPPVWAVYDESGRRLDGSDGPARPLDAFAGAGPDGEQNRVNATWEGGHWRVVRRTLRHPHPEAIRTTPARPRYHTLVFVTAWPAAPAHDLLRTMAWSLGGVSVTLWVAAGLGGRWLCRRALAPVARMTESAKRITAADLGERLPVPAARDELHDLAARFNDLLARLQDSFERQKRFTGEASHQLRTPLTAMLGQMEVALRRDRAPDEYRRVLTTAVAQAGRLRQIVESLLFLARADADAELPGLEIIDLTAWVRDYLASHLHDRAGDIRFDAPRTSANVKAQPAMLAQVVGNLIDNACKYSNSGTPVVVSVAVAGGEAVLSIEDAGHGIDPAEVGRIFEPFFRSAEARRRGVSGLGLGLAVVARIARSFGARIDVQSEPGRGSQFDVRFSLADEI
ncbi:HAMP domain-containing histidine kinase [Gemmata sp. JC673]|uniref:histidine kinase n=1 Tax=Gemmata algarum TaxID=2975278 RepID=A0ABU5ESC9_9BACT|nr:ATP-binding protein [Gemmata algarum]MDY3558159.1 HAMP domain-containing histidine kinase [Gemmata algarum]